MHQEEETKRWAGCKKAHPTQLIPANYTTSDQHEKNKTTLITFGVVAGLASLIIYAIY